MARGLFSISVALLAFPLEKQQELVSNLKTFDQELQQECGMSVRDDSRLVWRLITGNLPMGWTADRVKHELSWLKLVHEYTNYSSRYKCMIPFTKRNVEQVLFQGPLASKNAYDFTQQLVVPLFRLKAFGDWIKHGNSFKTGDWPWLKTCVPEKEPEDGENQCSSPKEDGNTLKVSAFDKISLGHLLPRNLLD